MGWSFREAITFKSKEENMMATVLILLKMLSVGIGVFIGWFWGGLDALVYLLIVLIIVDYISDIMRGVINKELSNVAGIREISQKILIMLLVGVANIIDIYLIRSENFSLKTAVTFFYITNQGISLLENAAIIGIPVPKVLKDTLLKYQKEKDDS
jgi:toxin secretion/phage lysis holin